jgi:hypothetical protein
MSEREIELLSALLALPWWLTLFATLFAGIAVFGGLWLTRRIESAAGRAVATAMLDHQHELDGKLESTRSELTKAQLRFSHDYSIYAAKRNEVFETAYRLLEDVRGQYWALLGDVRKVRSFSNSALPSIQSAIAGMERLSAEERQSVVDAIDRGDLAQARELANALWLESATREARGKLWDFKNHVIFNRLYLSEALFDELWATMNLLSILDREASHLKDPRAAGGDIASTKLAELDGYTVAIARRLRGEIQGDDIVASAPSIAAPRPRRTQEPA